MHDDVDLENPDWVNAAMLQYIYGDKKMKVELQKHYAEE